MSSASDMLKAALEKKRQQNFVPGKKDKKNAGTATESHGQVVVNKPQKKSTGRGR
jgi:hypothetical protein